MDKEAVPILLVLALIFIGGAYFFFTEIRGNAKTAEVPYATDGSTSTGTSGTEQSMDAPSSGKGPAMQIDMKKSYKAVLTTSEGPITIELNAKQTPITVNNFVKLSKDGFYDTTIFHRVIDGFMIQGGDPNTRAAETDSNRYGTGGPGYKFDDEPFEGEYKRGTVAMANSGPNTNGSQFFIMHADYPLPPSYTIFGKVVEGMDVVDKIATAEVMDSGMEKSKPVNPVKIQSVEIIEE